ncbi:MULTISPECIES: hypothetical protein [Pseudoxanthomonas]|jgi:hypothetical protein|uniref:Uncharacterized protein n=1 Tax=Pseudoxanthomonas winnipegensis TaxID=2480810 RepID=A0A4V2HCW4_9GAMM|nr:MULTISPECIES: hypothetical protein [Pseudoxanthomonas]TAA24333.1 hypothetical protein EA660_11380 [Pseudoxanthomonas winnipegensis]TMN17695.1 hypothetical protein FF950_16375 [Pseudoxanthomonas sp. X-1]UAY75870.1 hypothetical protein LAJ50_06420 [Pseudoxanthomonas sp. X-1]
MHHARQHAQTQTAERRRRLAHEAARLIAESGIRDYRQAKLKAASRLGISDDASLPRNREIEEALREYQRLFAGPDHAGLLRARREAALQAMEFFAGFAPRLVGPVLDGTADAQSPVQLHLHSDDEEAVARFLEDHRIPADARVRRLRMDRQRTADVTVWVFVADGIGFDIAVLPRQALRQAPLSVVDEAPMDRASATQLAALLAREEIAGYEGLPAFPG